MAKIADAPNVRKTDCVTEHWNVIFKMSQYLEKNFNNIRKQC